MFNIYCVTSRILCEEDFLHRIEKIAISHPAGIILREKDLSELQYGQLAKQVVKICTKHQIPCVLHSFVDTAIELNAKAIHLPLPKMREMSDVQRRHFKIIGVSCHSTEEAREAERLGCTYIIAGHIFATGCKKGLPGRGIRFLEGICKSVSVPVYAIGGIECNNARSVCKAGAKGACIMSGFMTCNDLKSFMMSFEEVDDSI
ncbi:thiamine phosphate synthase [Clostridium boliviensis]|uniref:Thiamine phosphate synthase n=1 Tax=Clostridium boliviensis TaxID=318465 RepID=A0ABU4GPH3_9CLOT|nr:thiamine phosphate synthase [Clostridium boliviensis]MDW2799516.1 thiamine phosphate synthase [Clostridium boliviensis]